MKIGVDINSLGGGRGPARYTAETIKALSLLNGSGTGMYLYSAASPRIPDLSGKVVVRHVPLQLGAPWLNWTLPRAARRDGIDVMLFPANDCWLWRAIPAVVVLLDIAQRTAVYEFLPRWKDRLQIRLQMERMGRIAGRIVTISNFSANEIRRALPGAAHKVEVIYCGLSEPFSSFNAVPRKEHADPYILFVGGFDRRKNLERLLHAFTLLRRRGRTERLCLVGQGGKNHKLYYDMPVLIRQFDLDNSVTVLGGVGDHDLADYYAGAELLVLPSTIEGFGFPVIEAQACGCPVVCSEAASLPEAGGNAACYFDPCDVSAIADAMEKVLADKRYADELREKGRKNARRFSWNTGTRRLQAILQSIAGEACAPGGVAEKEGVLLRHGN